MIPATPPLGVLMQLGTGPIQLTEQPIYGADRSGTLFRQANNYQYTISDHVGNTRVVINRNKLASGAADIVYYADYYPFGSEVRSGGTDSRYGYQGLYAEKDKETGWNNFELRNYDSAIGRWLTTDPKNQFHSPYVGMGNNPVSGFDKDGGWSEDGDPPVKKGYWKGFVDGTNISNPFDKAGQTWTRWIGEGPAAMINDLGKASSGFIYALGSLTYGPTYVNFYNDVTNFISSTSYEKGYGNGLNSLVESSVVASPFLYLKFNSSLLKAGGSTFSEYKMRNGGTETLGYIPTSTGAQRISTEFSHTFITQRMQKRWVGEYNWLVNNKLNVWKVNTIQHAIIDKYRFRFLRRGMKEDVGLFKKYGWFYKVNK